MPKGGKTFIKALFGDSESNAELLRNTVMNFLVAWIIVKMYEKSRN